MKQRYRRNIDLWISQTRHLSGVEEGALVRLVDYYYRSNEKSDSEAISAT
jgi:uncharacterized protein YdaU (DUF1376 family)